MSNEVTDNIMTSLKVISRVRQNERISTSGEVATIENGGWIQPIRRWWFEESRQNNLHSLNSIIDSAFSHLNLMKQKKEITSTDRVFTLRLEQELRNTVAGLQNLRTTYETDSEIIARIDLLVDKINDQMKLNDMMAKKTADNAKK